MHGTFFVEIIYDDDKEERRRRPMDVIEDEISFQHTARCLNHLLL